MLATFRRECLQQFDFLVRDFGFRFLGIEEVGVLAVTGTYVNGTTGVEVSIEPRERRVLVYLIQLVTGRIPAYLDEPSHHCLLDVILALRGGPPPARREAQAWLTATEVKEALAQYAAALQTRAADVLSGDFAVFAAAERWLDQHAPPDMGPAIDVGASRSAHG